MLLLYPFDDCDSGQASSKCGPGAGSILKTGNTIFPNQLLAIAQNESPHKIAVLTSNFYSILFGTDQGRCKESRSMGSDELRDN
jgi:hypothetical protein